jgi:DNA-binding NarL/FixJ family response regulator
MRRKESSGERIRTLLVDDSPGFLKAATGFLNATTELEVIGSARSGEEALLQVDELCPDLVLMDLTMPGMGGFEATCRLKNQKVSPRVVILTLHDTPEYRSRARAKGADGFVPKDEFGAQLLPLIHDLFNRD